MAVGELSSLFCLAGRSPRLKRAELLTWDEARDANVIFLGAPEANSRLAEIAVLQQFAFKSSREEPRLGTGGIVNLCVGPDGAEIDSLLSDAGMRDTGPVREVCVPGSGLEATRSPRSRMNHLIQRNAIENSTPAVDRNL
jgi:hypothetical protein